MSEKLKSCPFCGCMAEIVVTGSGCTGYSKFTQSLMVRCKGCGVVTKEYVTEVVVDDFGKAAIIINGYDNAQKAWNRREAEENEKE